MLLRGSAHLLVVLILLVGCSRPAGGDSSVSSLADAVRVPTPGVSEEAQVRRVVDGDTIDVSVGAGTRRIRYIGMNTPESVDPNRPVQCFGKEAAERNRLLVEGKRVRLERDISETDRFGRTLRYVWVGDVQINARLVQEGYAQVAMFPPDVRYQDLFVRLQREAQEAKRGLWGACNR